MTAELNWISEPTELDPNRVLCRYCARTMLAVPLTPREVAPHCTGKGCRWCGECATGQTSVSPVRMSG